MLRTNGTADHGCGEIDPETLVNAELPLVERGYDPDRVDELLERAARTIARLRALDEPALEQRRRTQAELLHRTLLLAQASADQHVAEAETTAGSLVADAQACANRLLAEAEQIGDQLVEAQAAQARAVLVNLVDRRLRLQEEIDVLERFAAAVRVRVHAIFASEAGELERLLSDVAHDRPVLRELDLTDPLFGPAETDEPLDAAAFASTPDRRPVSAVLVSDADARSA